MFVATREKSSQSNRIYFGALRDDKQTEVKFISRSDLFDREREYKNRRFVLFSDKEGK